MKRTKDHFDVTLSRIPEEDYVSFGVGLQSSDFQSGQLILYPSNYDVHESCNLNPGFPFL